MSEVRLTVGQGAGAETTAFKINGPRRDFVIETDTIEGWNSNHVEDRLLDLLDVAAAVFAADEGGGEDVLESAVCNLPVLVLAA